LDWRYDLGAGSRSNPLIYAKNIAVGSEKGLSIIENTGKPHCRFETAGEVTSSPKTDGTHVFFGSVDYTMYAIDWNCREIWKYRTRDRIKGDPLVIGDSVLIGSYDGHVYSLSSDKGEVRWMFPKVTPPSDQKQLPELSAAESDGFVGPRFPDQPDKVGAFSHSSPQEAGGIVYVGSNDGFFYALRLNDGLMLWRFRTGAPITSTPLIKDNTIYFGSNDGIVYAIDSDNQKPRWTWVTKGWVSSSPRIEDGSLYVGSNDRNLYAIDLDSGDGRWQHTLIGPSVARPNVFQNLVFTAGASGDGQIYAIQKQDGEIFWRFKTGAKIESDPVISENRLYVTSVDHTLYAFRINRTQED